MASVAVADMIDTRKMRYTGHAMSAMKSIGPYEVRQARDGPAQQESKAATSPYTDRQWSQHAITAKEPVTASSGRAIGQYPLTSPLAPWVETALAKYEPNANVREFVEPFTRQLHTLVEEERRTSTGLHDLDLVERTYQLTLEICAEILLAADATEEPVERQSEYHSSKAAKDQHFVPWGRLLMDLECDPPIIAMFPVYLMMCQSFTFTKNPLREDYVYSALTGVDWAQGKGNFSDRLEAFEKLARSSVKKLDDRTEGHDRCFWRISQGYVRAMNDCENSRPLKTPRKAAIKHNLDPDLIIAARGFDTLGSAYMANDGAAWLDEQGMDSLVGSGLPNDIMDLHTDIVTGETRNLLRCLYPEGLNMQQAMQTLATCLSGELCELFRGHHRARFGGREDGRLAASSPPYSFSRAQHRKIFEIMEAYMRKYPSFWEWTWEIFRMAKEQVTEQGLREPLVSALKRSMKRECLPPSEETRFFGHSGGKQMSAKSPLGVSIDVAQVTRDIHSLWHDKLLADDKAPGWGKAFDAESDRLFGEAGEILGRSEGRGTSDDLFKFAIAYGRLSMSLPYLAYHTVAVIILVDGIVDL
ncbi:hypothetical protein PRZ48_010180 [Zasmidium cellare]|uniref:Uncharacterized protein n=1 Tax=Zasmidium cellare TaxID=395010 RepID=A0ABR0EDW6_ZASCE|nr:hypothetical protein PRZ48_010180 [Zasmidium cellare]